MISIVIKLTKEIIPYRLSGSAAGRCFRALRYSVLYLLFLAHLSLFLFGSGFSDESDNIIGGMVVASGKEIYRDFYSQHTPLMYYLMGLFKVLGASTLVTFRFSFYAFLALIYTSMFARYHRHFGRFALLLYPLLYIGSFASTGNHSSTILSEHIHSAALVVLLLEFLLCVRTRALARDNLTWIALASFAAIGVAFVSIYPVALILGGIGVLNSSRTKSLKEMVLSNGSVLLAFLAPFLAFLFWYGFRGNLGNFVYQAFVFNRTVYSKYLCGFGLNPFAPVLQVVHTFYHLALATLQDLIHLRLSSYRVFLNLFANVAFSSWLARKNLWAGAVAFCFALLTLIRGAYGFHALAYWSTSASMLAPLFELGLSKVQEASPNRKRMATFYAVTAFTALYLTRLNVEYIIPFWKKPAVKSPAATAPAGLKAKSREFYVNTLLRQDEGFYSTSLDSDVFINTQRLPSIKTYTAVPWFTEVWESDLIDQLEASHTRLIFHDPKNAAWNYIFEDYAPRLNRYILTHYTQVRGQNPEVYLRNEDFADFQKVLAAASPADFSP